jgi:H+/Cl- antiporter ClcA
MSQPRLLAHWLRSRLESLRIHLARPDALFWHVLLGLVTGLVAGTVIVAFRLVVEGTQAAMLPGNGENYEALPVWVRLSLPFLGALLIAAIFWRFAKGTYVLGVARVMERMEYHQGHFEPREFIMQFLGAALAIASGHSVGREGPHVHLGAASGSLLGQLLRLPNNSIRTIVVCGTAAGIAASFNTPLAGVIFALEVFALEYSIAAFMPVMLAAVSADAVSLAVFGSAPAFHVPPILLSSLDDLLPVAVLGLFAGVVSVVYIQSLQTIARLGRRLAFVPRLAIAGATAGLLGALAPAVMGLGYDTQATLLTQHAPWSFLVTLLVVKLLATSTSIGLGIPGGTIGPALFMGAILGNLVGGLAADLGIIEVGDVSFYALLGMGAMMGASLQAPLAALTAVLELSHSPGVIMPGMLAIILAALTAREVFGKDSMFVTMLRANGLDYRTNPVVEMLRRSGVGGVMNRDFVRHGPHLRRAEAKDLIGGDGPRWVIVERDGRPTYLMPGIAVATYLAQNLDEDEIDLLAIPAERLELAPVHLEATLKEALDILQSQGAEALYVQRPIAPGINRIYGVLTRERIESAYRY